MKLRIKLNTQILKHKKDSILIIDCDCNGIPYNNFWYQRLIDSKIDNCFDILDNLPSDEQQTTSKKAKK